MRFSVVAKKSGISKDKKEWYCLVIFDSLCTALSTCFIKKSIFDLYDVNDDVSDDVEFFYNNKTSSYFLRIPE